MADVPYDFRAAAADMPNYLPSLWSALKSSVAVDGPSSAPATVNLVPPAAAAAPAATAAVPAGAPSLADFLRARAPGSDIQPRAVAPVPIGYPANLSPTAPERMTPYGGFPTTRAAAPAAPVSPTAQLSVRQAMALMPFLQPMNPRDRMMADIGNAYRTQYEYELQRKNPSATQNYVGGLLGALWGANGVLTGANRTLAGQINPMTGLPYGVGQ